MKKILTLSILLLSLTATQTYGQQIHQLTQYFTNDYAFNPAVAGSDVNFQSKLSFRKQWTGLEGAPTTGLLSVHGNLSEKRSIGLGMLLFTDKTGPTSRTGINLSYAYHLPLQEDETYLGFGVSGVLMGQRIDGDALEFIEEEPTAGRGVVGQFGADANLGVYLRNEKYWAGLSINQLFGTKFNPFDTENENFQNSQHFYLTGGYRYDINDDIAVEPALLMKGVKGAGVQFDIHAKAIYAKQYWAGLTYRTEDALSFLVGLNLKNGFNFAYSYDITTSNLNTVSNGAHELTLGFNFNIFGDGYNGGISPRYID